MRTVEDLRACLAEAGLDPDDVGRAEDPSLPRLDGVLLVRTMPAGVRVSTWERGQEHFPRDFSSEAEAVRHLGARLLDRRPVSPQSPEQVADSGRRMQEKARRILAELQHRKADDP